MMGMYQSELMEGYCRPSYLPGEWNKGVLVNKSVEVIFYAENIYNVLWTEGVLTIVHLK